MQDRRETHPFLQVSHYGSLGLHFKAGLEHILRKGENPDLPEARNIYPIFCAVDLLNPDALQLLIDYGADLSLTYRNLNLLWFFIDKIVRQKDDRIELSDSQINMLKYLTDLTEQGKFTQFEDVSLQQITIINKLLKFYTESKHRKVAKMLLDALFKNLNLKNEKLKSKIFCEAAAFSHHYPHPIIALKFLLSHGFSANSIHPVTNKHAIDELENSRNIKPILFLIKNRASLRKVRYFSLHRAIKNAWQVNGPLSHARYIKLLRKSIEHTPNINKVDDNGVTPLHVACGIDASFIHKTISLLILNGAAVHALNAKGETPLHTRVSNVTIARNISSYKHSLRALIKAGADINQLNRAGVHPVFMTVFQPAIQVLIKLGADAKARNTDGNTLLHTPDCSVDVAKLVLKKGLGINEVNQTGQTPLMMCINTAQATKPDPKNPMDFFNFLLAAHADVNLIDHAKQTALLYAALKLRLDLITALLAHGANVNDQDEPTGNTALHIAAKHNRRDIFEFLLQNGADPKITNNEGKTASELTGRTAIARLCAERGSVTSEGFFARSGSPAAPRGAPKNGKTDAQEEMYFVEEETSETATPRTP